MGQKQSGRSANLDESVDQPVGDMAAVPIPPTEHPSPGAEIDEQPMGEDQSAAIALHQQETLAQLVSDDVETMNPTTVGPTDQEQAPPVDGEGND